VLLWSEEDQCYVATLPAWQTARTHGATLEEATRNAREAEREGVSLNQWIVSKLAS